LRLVLGKKKTVPGPVPAQEKNIPIRPFGKRALPESAALGTMKRANRTEWEILKTDESN